MVFTGLVRSLFYTHQIEQSMGHAIEYFDR